MINDFVWCFFFEHKKFNIFNIFNFKLEIIKKKKNIFFILGGGKKKKRLKNMKKKSNHKILNINNKEY